MKTEELNLACRICGNEDNNKTYTAREMMFGFRDEFDYVECSKCGCVQIAQIPENMDKYYPPNYYSYQFRPDEKLSFRKRIRRKFVNHNLNYMQDYINIWDKIIDIGCGNGEMVYLLKAAGFNACGYDPYIEEKIKHNNGAVIYKDINEIKNKKFSVVIMKHSFEHMSNPQEMFNLVSERLLNKNGKFIVGIPLALYAWEKYRTNWVQLDPPRHFFAHTPESIKILAKNAGLKIKEIIFDSQEFQFWASESYINDIPLTLPECYESWPPELIAEFKNQAEELNERQQGDQATFILTKCS